MIHKEQKYFFRKQGWFQMSQALSFWEDSICIFNVDMHILSDKKKDQKEEGKKKRKKLASTMEGREWYF